MLGCIFAIIKIIHSLGLAQILLSLINATCMGHFRTIRNHLLLICLFLPLNIFTQPVGTEYRIQVMLLCSKDFESAKTISDGISRMLEMPAYVLNKDGCFKILAGDFNSFRQAQEKIDYVRIYFDDAWISPAYQQYVAYPLPETRTESIDLTELIEIALEIKHEIQEVKLLMSEVLQETKDIREFLAQEQAPVIPDLDTSLLEESEESDTPVADDKNTTQKLFWKIIYAGGAYVDLHAGNPQFDYLDYYGFSLGLGASYAFNPYLAVDLTTDYTFAYANPKSEIYDVTGNTSILRVSPSLMLGTNIHKPFRVYGKLGASYFNYDYTFSLEMKPGFSNGPSSIDAELLSRASDIGFQFGAGIKAFRYIDLYVGSYLDLNSRRFHTVTLGITF